VTSCASGTADITNCNYSMATSTTVNSCVQCNDNFVMDKNSNTACNAFSNNKYCTQKDAAGTGCYACQSGYYFDATNCIKRSLFVGASLMLLGLLISIFN